MTAVAQAVGYTVLLVWAAVLCWVILQVSYMAICRRLGHETHAERARREHYAFCDQIAEGQTPEAQVVPFRPSRGTHA